MKKFLFSVLIIFTSIFFSAIICGCAGNAASAQEYFSIGMAYFDLGKYEDAEKWLNRAMQSDRTMTASQYNLGRLAFERQRYNEAAKYFEDILKIDPNNVLALRAAAYTRIKTGEIDIAQRHYSRLMVLIPENADDGYNHALVLYAMERYDEAEQVLEKYHYSLLDNRDLLLLYARTQGAQNKVEAIDTFSSWLAEGSDPKVRYEYALALENNELYARALEELQKAITEVTSSTTNIKISDIRFALARVLLIADGDSTEGITEMRGAVEDGFDDVDALEKLIESGKVTGANRESLRDIASGMRRTEAARIEAEEAQKSEEEKAEDNISETDPEGGSQ
jgi:tetratricopeptide (TPR) repeat protein